MFFARLLLMAVAATLACGTETVGPSEFYAVSVFFSDSGALFYYRVIDVRPDGLDSLIRYTRVALSLTKSRRYGASGIATTLACFHNRSRS
jgi:hypothetical protein